MIETLRAPAAAVADLLKSKMMIFIAHSSGSRRQGALLDAVREAGIGDLTLIFDRCATTDAALLRLIAGGQVRRVICSGIDGAARTKPAFEIEINSPARIAERIAAGVARVPSFLAPEREGAAEPIYTRETWLRPDLALIHAWRADLGGSLAFRAAPHALDPMIATAADVVVAEVEEVQLAGPLDPDCIQIRGVHVDRVVCPAQRPAQARDPDRVLAFAGARG